MIRTGQEYRDSIGEDSIVYINGERDKNAAVHSIFKFADGYLHLNLRHAA